MLWEGTAPTSGGDIFPHGQAHRKWSATPNWNRTQLAPKQVTVIRWGCTKTRYFRRSAYHHAITMPLISITPTRDGGKAEGANTLKFRNMQQDVRSFLLVHNSQPPHKRVVFRSNCPNNISSLSLLGSEIVSYQLPTKTQFKHTEFVLRCNCVVQRSVFLLAFRSPV